MPPGLCIGIFSLGLALVNYAIDEVTNPKLHVQKVRSDTEEQNVRTTRPAAPTETQTNASVA
jgi:hypothetical protein